MSMVPKDYVFPEEEEYSDTESSRPDSERRPRSEKHKSSSSSKPKNKPNSTAQALGNIFAGKGSILHGGATQKQIDREAKEKREKAAAKAAAKAAEPKETDKEKAARRAKAADSVIKGKGSVLHGGATKSEIAKKAAKKP